VGHGILADEGPLAEAGEDAPDALDVRWVGQAQQGECRTPC
jgi:hypothetical protein